MYDVPILLIIFNRPNHLQKVFHEIKKIQPKQLFIAADGPRDDVPSDFENCQACRNFIETAIDWDCDVKKNYAEKNLGCGKRPASGISWVLAQVDRVIILEDDCVPTQSFFRFMKEMLERYKNDERIGIVSGDNVYSEKIILNKSYGFQKIPHCCGWATWARVWKNYDFEIKRWPEKRKNLFKNLYPENPSLQKISQTVFSPLFQEIFKKKMTSAWDYQLCFLCFEKNFLTVFPKNNLVRNIGFDEFGTHTIDENDFMKNLMAHTKELNFPLQHPEKIEWNEELERVDLANYMAQRKSGLELFFLRLNKIKKFYEEKGLAFAVKKIWQRLTRKTY